MSFLFPALTRFPFTIQHHAIQLHAIVFVVHYQAMFACWESEILTRWYPFPGRMCAIVSCHDGLAKLNGYWRSTRFYPIPLRPPACDAQLNTFAPNGRSYAIRVQIIRQHSLNQPPHIYPSLKI
jgi:hypothetical protein